MHNEPITPPTDKLFNIYDIFNNGYRLNISLILK